MAELDAKRYKLIIEALEYKVKNKDNRLANRYKGWDYMGRNGIFWTARRNFPQVYNKQHPEQTYESEIEFAEAIVRAHNLKLDPVLEKFFDEIEAPTIGEETAAIIDSALKQEAPPPSKSASTTTAQKAPTPLRSVPPKENRETASESTPPTLTSPNPISESLIEIPANQPNQTSLSEESTGNLNKPTRASRIKQTIKRVKKTISRENIPREIIDHLPAEPKSQAQRRFSFSKVFSAIKPVTTFAGGRLSNLGPGFKTMSTRIGLNLGSMGSGLLNGLSGGANGMGNLLGRGLNSSGPRVPAKVGSSLRGIAGKVGGNKKWLWLLLLFLIVFIIMSGGGWFPPGLGINSCKFTNGDESLAVNSSRLQGIFQEVSAKSQIPSAVLASISMHTNKDFTSSASNEHEAFKGLLNEKKTDCKSFGATREGGLGLMQVRRNDPSDPSQEGLKLGAKLAGLENPEDPNKITLSNFCDIRINVYLAAGILTVKNGGTPPQKGSDINRAACGYFPSPFCLYGLLNKYNYGQDVQTDTEKCVSGSGGVIPPGGGSGDLSKCTFTRSDNPKLIKSTILQGWIKAAADAEQISPYVLASVVMHESQEFVSNAENDHDAIQTDHFCNPGLIFCEKDGQVLHPKVALGEDTSKDFPCSAEEIAGGARNAQAKGLSQLVDIFNQDKGDLCSITNNLAIAAKKLKADGITTTPDQTQINKAIDAYYNSCNYGSFSYCNEVWDDTQRCIANQPPPPLPVSGVASSCPIDNGKISTGSYYSGLGRSQHCNAASNYSPACNPNSRRAKSIDIPTGEQAPKLPTINGQNMKWNYISNYDDANGGWAHVFRATDSSGTNWDLQLLHLQRNTLLTGGGPYDSGTPVARPGLSHVHVTIGKNVLQPTANCGSNRTDAEHADPNICNTVDPGWLAADTDMHMCTGTAASAVTSITSIDLSPANDSSGTKIKAYRVGPESNSNKILIIGGMNGSSEKPGIDIVNALFTNSADPTKGSLSSTIKLPTTTTLYIIPQLWSGVDGFNANSKDINRNFDANESKIPGGSWSSVGCSLGRYKTELSKGATPFGGSTTSLSTSCQNEDVRNEFSTYCSKSETTNRSFYCTDGQTGNGGSFSEPETQAIKNLVESNGIKAVLSFRAPYNNVSHTNASLSGSDPTKILAVKMKDWLSIPYQEYWVDYPVRGQFMDWLYDKGVIGVEVEAPSYNQKYLDAINNALNDPILK